MASRFEGYLAPVGAINTALSPNNAISNFKSFDNTLTQNVSYKRTSSGSPTYIRPIINSGPNYASGGGVINTTIIPNRIVATTNLFNRNAKANLNYIRRNSISANYRRPVGYFNTTYRKSQNNG